VEEQIRINLSKAVKHIDSVFSHSDSTGWIVVMPKHDLVDFSEADVAATLRKKWKVNSDFHSSTKCKSSAKYLKTR
jgi:hypothetical protein